MCGVMYDIMVNIKMRYTFFYRFRASCVNGFLAVIEASRINFPHLLFPFSMLFLSIFLRCGSFALYSFSSNAFFPCSLSVRFACLHSRLPRNMDNVVELSKTVRLTYILCLRSNTPTYWSYGRTAHKQYQATADTATVCTYNVNRCVACV